MQRGKTWRQVVAVGCLILPMALAACSGGGGGGGAAGGTTVKGSEYKFDPATINAEAGKPVTLTFDNGGTVAHDWKAEGVAGAEVKETAPKQKNTITFTAPAAGTYKVLCTLPGHAEAGMVGQLVVK